MMLLVAHLFVDCSSNTIISFTNERIPSLVIRLGIHSPIAKY